MGLCTYSHVLGLTCPLFLISVSLSMVILALYMVNHVNWLSALHTMSLWILSDPRCFSSMVVPWPSFIVSGKGKGTAACLPLHAAALHRSIAHHCMPLTRLLLHAINMWTMACHRAVAHHRTIARRRTPLHRRTSLTCTPLHTISRKSPVDHSPTNGLEVMANKIKAAALASCPSS